MIKSSI